MKKLLSVVVAVVLIITALPLTSLNLTASAASYPSVIHKRMGMTIYCGDTVPLVFYYSPAYNYEKITINVYAPDGTLAANSVFDIDNRYSNYGSLTSTWDTTGYTAGKYNIEIIKEFYSLYSWHTAPTSSTSYVNLVEPSDKISLNNTYTGNNTHFQVRNNSSANATNKNIENAYNAWQKLTVSNVSNPYEIQLTEMYIGKEAEDIAVSENMFNTKNETSCQWVLTKFEIKNNGKSSLEASDTIDWINAYLPTGEKATLIDICTFGDLPNYDTVIEPGETKEAWFGFYTLETQGIPFLKLDNGAYIYTHPNCASGHKFSNACDTSCNTCHAKRSVVHNYSVATCAKAKTCKVCGTTSGKALGHTYKNIVTKSTLKANGKIVKKCSVCGTVAGTTVVYYPKTVKLAKTTYDCTGKTIAPTVTVKNSKGKALKKGTDYTVTYASGRKNVGNYKVTVTFKGNYTGTKTLNFTINPAKTTVNKLVAGKKSLKVTIAKKTTQVTGYEIQYAANKSFKSAKTKNIKSYKTTSVTLTKLTAKKNYYVRVRTYKTVGGKKYYSAWSGSKYKKTK